MEELLTCPICQREGFKNLNTHIVRVHNLSITEFKVLYPSYKLFLESCREDFIKGANNMLKVRNSKKVAEKAWKTKLAKNPNYASEWSKKLWKNSEYRKWKIEQVKLQHKDGGLTDIVMKNMHKHKRIDYTTKSGKHYKFRSSWELKFAQLLDTKDINYTYEELKIKYYDSELNKERTYYPDFYVRKDNLILEVKPKYLVESINVQDKKKACLKLGYNYKFITEDELFNE